MEGWEGREGREGQRVPGGAGVRVRCAAHHPKKESTGLQEMEGRLVRTHPFPQHPMMMVPILRICAYLWCARTQLEGACGLRYSGPHLDQSGGPTGGGDTGIPGPPLCRCAMRRLHGLHHLGLPCVGRLPSAVNVCDKHASSCNTARCCMESHPQAFSTKTHDVRATRKEGLSVGRSGTPSVLIWGGGSSQGPPDGSRPDCSPGCCCGRCGCRVCLLLLMALLSSLCVGPPYAPLR